MADLPTRTDLFDAGAREVIARSEARAPAKRLAPEAIYTPGSDINVLLAGASAMAEDVLRQHSQDQADLFLRSARGERLDRLVIDRYSRSLARKEAAPAVVTLSFFRTGGALAAGSLSVGFRVRTATGLEFELTQAVSFTAGAFGPVTATARCTLAGASTNAAAGTINDFVSTPFDPDLQVTNDDPATGGADRETDFAYANRAQLFFIAARRGTKAAIEFGALTVPGIASVSAEEQLDDSGVQTGVVFVYIADANGQANDVLQTMVSDALLEFRCMGIPPFIVGATPEYVPITYRLRFRQGTDQVGAFEQVRFGTVALVNQTAPGSPLEVSLLLGLARRVPGVIVLDDALVTPLGDVYPSVSGRIIKTRTDLVTLETA